MESLELIHADYRKISNLEGKSANDFDSLHNNLDWDQISQLFSVAKDAVEVDSSDLTIQEAVDRVQNLAILRGLL